MLLREAVVQKSRAIEIEKAENPTEDFPLLSYASREYVLTLMERP